VHSDIVCVCDDEDKCANADECVLVSTCGHVEDTTHSFLLQGGVSLADAELRRQLAELWKASNGQVLVINLPALNLRQDERLCLLHNRQHPRLAISVLVRSNAEVELLVSLVFVEVGCGSVVRGRGRVRVCVCV
jgi:hypothetical protein